MLIYSATNYHGDFLIECLNAVAEFVVETQSVRHKDVGSTVFSLYELHAKFLSNSESEQNELRISTSAAAAALILREY